MDVDRSPNNGWKYDPHSAFIDMEGVAMTVVITDGYLHVAWIIPFFT